MDEEGKSGGGGMGESGRVGELRMGFWIPVLRFLFHS